MKNSEYWKQRMIAVENMLNAQSKDAVKSLIPAFDKAQAQIEKELLAWYQRFAVNNQVDLVEAKKLLNAKQLKELKWDINKYIQYGKDNAINQSWMKELENASAKFHISRLESLKLRTQQAVEEAFNTEEHILSEHLVNIYQDDYYHTAFEIQKGTGIGFQVGTIDNRKLNKLLTQPWTLDKKTFSDRIWQSKTDLLDSVSKELTQMCILGKAPDETIKNIANRMQVSKSQAGRLVMTESAYIASVAQKNCYSDLNVEQYEIVATLDRKTSEICQQMDGKHFKMSDFQAGVSAPPFHPWCRTTTVPYFDDEWGREGTRAARGEDGKTYQVPADMKYEEWKKKFVGEKERELEYGVEYGNLNCDLSYFKSKEFKDKIEQLDYPQPVKESILSCSIKAATENTGTKLESMYLINAKTGDIVASIDKQKDKIESGVSYTEDFKEALQKARKKGTSIISIHNHPEGYPPSLDDFMKAYENGYTDSFAVGHNGQLYRYQNKEVSITKKQCDEVQNTIAFMYKQGYDIDRAYMKEFKNLGLNYGIL